MKTRRSTSHLFRRRAAHVRYFGAGHLEDYVRQRYRSLATARGRVEHLRSVFCGWLAETITSDEVRSYQLLRRKSGAETSTINRETSALSRMFQLAVRRGQLDRMPIFPKRLEENPPREGFFEHEEYLKVRAELPTSYQDVLDFAYYSGWRKQEILGLTWDEVDLRGGVIRLRAARSKTKTGRVLPISPPVMSQSTAERPVRPSHSKLPGRVSRRFSSAMVAGTWLPNQSLTRIGLATRSESTI